MGADLHAVCCKERRSLQQKWLERQGGEKRLYHLSCVCVTGMKNKTNVELPGHHLETAGEARTQRATQCIQSGLQRLPEGPLKGKVLSGLRTHRRWAVCR